MTFYNVCFVVAFWLEARPKAIFWVQKNKQDKKNGFTKNTSLVAPGALANRLQRRTASKANEANLDFPNL